MVNGEVMKQDIDGLAILSKKLPISEKLIAIHDEIKEHAPFIHRVAVAIYEEERDLLKTFVCSCGDRDALSHYQSVLSNSPSLKRVAEDGEPRVVNDLSVFGSVPKQHSKKIGHAGYGASYTCPIYNDGAFVGFVFFNSKEKNVFTPVILNKLSLFVHLISFLVIKEMELIKVLHGSVCTALDISHHRDPETGEHLERMSRYSRLIANALAESHNLTDEYIEYLFRFAPLHDVGKIAIPDSILLKQGRLDEDEYEQMKTHAKKGKEIVLRMINNLQLHNLKYTEMLINIIELHHETLDGRGYPNQLKGDAIPLEARVIAVADIFDALTSERPYKKAWTNDEAFDELKKLAGVRLDADCVAAMINNRETVEAIQKQFQDDLLG